jgi:hypothetical protein
VKAQHPHPGGIILKLDIVLGSGNGGFIVLLKCAYQVIVPHIGIFHRIIAFVRLPEGIIQVPENGKSKAVILVLEKLLSLPEFGLRISKIRGLLGK